jgi:hypothetical protein
MNPGFALTTTNCVIDQYGRIGARKGWIKANTASTPLGSANVEVMAELIANDGTSYILCGGNGKLFKLSYGALVELTYGGGGVAPTITLNNWQTANLNGICYFFQRGYDALIFDPSVSTTTFRRVTEKAGYVATVPQANTVISAYGRLWTADTSTDKNTITFSDTITGHVWSTGTAGTLNVIGVWPNGSDEIVALAAHNNFLVIFGRRQTLIYSGANIPSTMTLSDSITGIGCIARDSVQAIGEDLIFLSSSGVRSLQRTIQEKSAPLRDLSKNIRDHITIDINFETLDNIKSGYSGVESFYLLSLPASLEVYCFDTRGTLEDGSAKITVWDSILPTSFLTTRDRKFYIGKAGFMGEYTGYLDDTSTYVMKYYTPHINFGGLSSSSILKKISLGAIGGAGQVINVFYASDYSANYNTGQITFPAGTESYFNSASYFNNTSYYSSGLSFSTINLQAGGAGKVLQFGFEMIVNGYQVSFQKLDIFTKIGKML